MRVSKWSKEAVVGVSLVLGTGIAVAQMGGSQGQSSQGMQQPSGANNPSANSGMNGMSDPNAGASGAPSMQDRMFLTKASEGGMFEVQAGQLALQKSASDDVKQFAQKMVDDHTKLDEQMKPLNEKASVKPSMELKGKEKKELDKLQGLSGQAFDAEYIKIMLKDHKDTSDAFKAEANMGQSPDEKNAASQAEPIIEQHLQMAKQLAQAHGISA